MQPPQSILSSIHAVYYFLGAQTKFNYCAAAISQSISHQEHTELSYNYLWSVYSELTTKPRDASVVQAEQLDYIYSHFLARKRLAGDRSERIRRKFLPLFIHERCELATTMSVQLHLSYSPCQANERAASNRAVPSSLATAGIFLICRLSEKPVADHLSVNTVLPVIHYSRVR